MTAVIDLLWKLCLLRVGPERMPTAGLFVALVVIANLTISALVAITSPYGADALDAISAPVIGAAVLATGTWLMLLAKGMSERFVATFTALMGADVIITLISWPVIVMTRPGETDAWQFLLALVQFALLFWWITVSGFVFARALDVSRIQGVAVAVFVVLTTLLVTASVFPPPGVEAASGATTART
ncbi:MAG TPA: hypothetical protein VLA56_10860 [Pseudomonadales bacterium]|nr:hypothetical protein [Pseudomonadales bacterium]